MSLKNDLTSKLIEHWLTSLNHSAPINLTFVTEPLSKALVSRVQSLEDIYNTFVVYRFLSCKRVYPVLLFTSVSSSLAYGFFSAYKKSTKLVLSLVGVLYPAYRCWKLIKDTQRDHNDDKLERWLTYWLIYGSFQVLDHWVESDLFTSSRKKYNLYKLLIFYWAQSPHSEGSGLIYRHVIRKPQRTQTETAESDQQKTEHRTIAKQEESVASYRYLDDFQPPGLCTTDHHQQAFGESKDNDGISSSSNSSSDDDSISSGQQHASNLISSAKDSFPPLMMSVSTEAAW